MAEEIKTKHEPRITFIIGRETKNKVKIKLIKKGINNISDLLRDFLTKWLEEE